MGDHVGAHGDMLFGRTYLHDNRSNACVIG